MKKLTILFLFLALAASGQRLLTTKFVNFPGSSFTINLASDVDIYYVYGSKTLGAAYGITYSGTPVNGQHFVIYYDGSSVTTAGYNITIMGVILYGTTAITATQNMFATSKYQFDCLYNGVSSTWDIRPTQDMAVTHWIQPGNISKNFVNDTTLFMNSNYQLSIIPGSLTNALISSGAAISRLKLAALTAGKVLVSGYLGNDSASSVTTVKLGYIGNLTSDAQAQITARPASGSILQTDFSGSMQIPYAYLVLTNSIVSADINSAAAIPYSKLYLTGSLLDADVASGAAIAVNKLAPVTATKVVISDGSGYLTTSAVTPTALTYIANLTSDAQTQINNASGGAISYTTISSNTSLTPATLKSQTWVNTTAGAVTIYVPRPDSVAAGLPITFTVWAANGATLHTYGSYSGFKTSASTMTVTYPIGTTNGDFVTLVSDGTYWIVSKAVNN